MTASHIARQRLRSQHIEQARFERPADLVQWLGAVQSQDYQGAKWAIGLRLRGATDAGIDAALADGSIIRTHVLRPTWHFVPPADVRWMLALSSTRIVASMASRLRELELDSATLRRSEKVLQGALAGGSHLTRAELTDALEQAGIATAGLRISHILMHAELAGLICSGGLRGKQLTYALLDERVPARNNLERDEALATLAARYFASHGPATERDFAWWAGLTLADARESIRMAKDSLVSEVIDGQAYWSAASADPVADGPSRMCLLPDFDEFFVGYTDRSASFDDAHTGKLDSRGSIINQYAIVVDGQAAGTWKRTIRKSSVVIEAAPFRPFTATQRRAFAAVAQRYGEFLGLPVELQ